jgi:hypothetical protein
LAATTANLIIYKGVYDDLITIWDRLVGEHLFFDCGASRNAYKQEGKKTLAYEIAEQTGFTVPDVVVVPVAVGETFIATARGFREMREAGWIARAPLMVAAQATRANAVSRAFRDGTAIAPLKIGYTVAEGLAAGDPGKKGEWVLRLLRDGKGLAGDAEDDEILETQRRLARVEGVWAGPTGVATPAVLERLPAQKQLDRSRRSARSSARRGSRPRASRRAVPGSRSTSSRSDVSSPSASPRCRCRGASTCGRRARSRATCSGASSSHGGADRSRRAASSRPRRISVPRTPPRTPPSGPAATRSSMVRAASPTSI